MNNILKSTAKLKGEGYANHFVMQDMIYYNYIY